MLTVPDVARFTILGRWTNGKAVDTVLDYKIDTTGTIVDRSDKVLEAAGDIIQNWQSQVMPFLANNYSVEGCHYLDLNTESGSLGIVGPDGGEPTAGSSSSAACTPNVCYLVHKGGGGQRGTRGGRMYIAGVVESIVGEDGVLDMTVGQAAEGLQGGVRDFLANTNQSALPLVAASRVMVVSHLGSPPAPGVEDNRVGTYSVVQDLILDPVVATQRRRLR